MATVAAAWELVEHHMLVGTWPGNDINLIVVAAVGLIQADFLVVVA